MFFGHVVAGREMSLLSWKEWERIWGAKELKKLDMRATCADG